MSDEELIEQIRASFADDPTRAEVGGMGVHMAYALDNFKNEEAAAAKDRETEHVHWSDLDRDILRRLRSAIVWLNDAGYRYYLPAFMLWALEEPESEAWELESFRYTLHDNSDRVPQLQEQLTVEQLRAVAAFVEHELGDEDDLIDFEARTLEYWRRLKEELR